MNLEDSLLENALRESLNDDRWALPVPPDSLPRLRRGRAARRRRTAVLTVTGCLALTAAGVAVATSLPHPSQRLGTYASGGNPPGSPVAGITPPFVPDSGRDWLLTSAQWAEFSRTHTHPSPGPGQSVVSSPAPLAEQSADLLADVEAAALPTSATLRREDSVGGQPGAAAVHVRLEDGTPVEVLRQQLQEPFAFDAVNGPGRDGNGENRDATVVDVPGTTSAASLYPNYGFGFPGESGAESRGVIVVSRGGVMTTWVAPQRVSLDTLRGWAIAAAQHAGN